MFAGPFCGMPSMRLRLASTLALAGLLLATPTFAAGLSGMGANLFGNYFHFPKPNLSKPPIKKITAGSLKIELQHTKLSQIAKAFGGTIQSSGEGSGMARWLCYHTDTANTWFISNSLGGFDFVMIVAVEAADPDRVPGDCEAAKGKFKVPDLGIPGLGASTADLKAAFGAASGSKIAYRADEPAADALGTANNAQYIGYVLKAGKVTGYGAGEASVQNMKK
jgi:hypothetical protein